MRSRAYGGGTGTDIIHIQRMRNYTAAQNAPVLFDGEWSKDDCLTDIEILTGKKGEPQVFLSGCLILLADNVFSSLTYDGKYAVAGKEDSNQGSSFLDS